MPNCSMFSVGTTRPGIATAVGEQSGSSDGPGPTLSCRRGPVDTCPTRGGLFPAAARGSAARRAGASAQWGEEREWYDGRLAVGEQPAVRFDRPELGVLEFAPHQAVGELSRLHVERRHVAGYLFSCLVSEDHFEYPVGRVLRPRADEDYEVGGNGNRRGCGRRHREHGPDQVHTGGGAGTWRRSKLSMNRAETMSM